MALGLRSGTAMCAFDGDLEIVAWNQAAERLTGIAAREALGRPCWAVLAGTAEDGSLACHRGCSSARLARQGWPLRERILSIRTAGGRRRVAVDTVTAERNGEQVLIHLFRPAPRPDPPRASGAVALTPRRLEVLRLLAQGLSVRKIAGRLGVTEATARNHVHALLVDLDSHSQLEAVSKGRRLGLV